MIYQIKKEKDFIKKDPNNQILLQREDFTNFMNFYKKYKNNPSLQERIFRYDPNFP